MAFIAIAGESHSFSVAEAIEHGVEAAIVLNAIRYWLRKNHSDGRNIKSGYVWTYNTAKKLHKMFPYWSEQKCQRLMKKLNDQKLVIVANHNTNKWVQERWYTLPEFKIEPVDNFDEETDNIEHENSLSDCNSAKINIDECNHQKSDFDSSRSMNVHSSNLMNDPYHVYTTDLTTDLRSIQPQATGIDPVVESFENIFWPAWEGRKIAHGECLSLFRKLVEQEGRSPYEFATELAGDIKRRLKARAQGFDKIHPKTYLKGRRWEDQLFAALPEQSNQPSKSSQIDRLKGRINELTGLIRSEEGYMASIRDDNPLRISIKQSCERKLEKLECELKESKAKLKMLLGENI